MVPAKKKPVLNFMLASAIFGVSVVGPPGIPKDRADVLRKAFSDMAKDKGYQADAIKMGAPVGDAHSGQKLRRLVADMLKNTTAEAISEYKRLTTKRR